MFFYFYPEMAQKEFIGKGTISKLKEVLAEHNPKSIFLVTGRASYEKCGAKGIIEQILSGYNVVHFNDFEVSPKQKDIEKGIKVYKENNCDFVIGVGGGSVMDVAKAIRAFVANDGKPEDYVKANETLEKKGNPLVAIPTTSGSGAEATHFAVVFIGKTKYSPAHEFIQPDYAIVDYQFTITLPRYQTACTGMDALSQGIESYWCINSTDESKGYAKEAISIVMENLAKAVNNPDEKSREAMAMAAHLGGKAINISKTTASHAISYPITSYFNIPHGHAVALTIPQMLVYNSGITEEDALDEIASLIGAKTVEEASKKITDLMEEIGLSTKLSKIGVKTDEDVEIIVKNGFNPQRVKNNPRLLTEADLRKILADIR
jgi:alcohol dehydrogenase class IV